VVGNAAVRLDLEERQAAMQARQSPAMHGNDVDLLLVARSWERAPWPRCLPGDGFPMISSGHVLVGIYRGISLLREIMR
jgi:hypothetical protein